MPGSLGHEPGVAPSGPSSSAYLTRSITIQVDEESSEWLERNGLGQGLDFSHNLSNIFPPELFAAKPEFFPMIAGRRWAPPLAGRVNWNPDLGEPAVAAHAAAAARRFFDEHPDAVSFALGTNDGLYYGESPATLRWTRPPRYFRGRPVYTDLVFQFMNTVAAELALTHPDKYLGGLAYYWAEQSPSFPLHPKVVPYLTADRSQGYDREFRREEDALQKRWAAAGSERLGIYDYIYGHGFLVPRVHTELLARYLKQARREGFTDYFAEMHPNWGLDGPQPWLVAQLLMDPKQGRRTLLAEYYRRYFKSSSGPMRRFFELCEHQWMTQEGPAYWLKHYRSETQAVLFPRWARAKLRAYLEEALGNAAGDPLVVERVRLVSEAFAVTERFVEFAEKRQALARAVLARPAVARGELRALRNACVWARDDFVRQYGAVKRDWPLALGTVRIDDFIRSDWVPTADWLLAGGEQGAGEELLPDPHWFLPIKPATTIAGLVYAPGVPEGWVSKSEPWAGLKTEFWADATGRRVLRLENHKASSFHTLVALPAAAKDAVLSVVVRGKASIGCRFWVHLQWAGAAGRIGEERTVILPPGDWAEPTKIAIPGTRPEGATHVALFFSVTDQQPGDWWEVNMPSVRMPSVRMASVRMGAGGEGRAMKIAAAGVLPP